MELSYSPKSDRLLPEAPPPHRPRAAPSTPVRTGDVAVASPVRPDGGSHAVGIGVVIAVHVVIGYALVSGLAQKVVDAVRAPVDVRLIEEIKPPPPPPPPEPPRQVVKSAPRLAPPPPVYVPPPQVQVAAPASPVIAEVTQRPQPDVKPAPPVVEAPPAPPPARAEPVAIGVVCPTLVTPVLPRRAQQEGIGGTVRAQATIRGGKVVQVDILSSKPRGLFDSAVRTAMLQYGCQSTGGGDVVATQNFEFRSAE